MTAIENANLLARLPNALRILREQRRRHSGETTTDSRSFHCAGFQAVGRHFNCLTLDQIIRAGERRLARARR